MPLTAYDLTGRTAFITGAASGIGRACAVLLAEAGATVHCADIDEKGLAETRSLISEAGGTAHTHPLDVSERAQVKSAIESAASSGRLDILAAVAGIMHSSTVLETRDEDLDRVLAVNFKGILYACQESVCSATALPRRQSSSSPRRSRPNSARTPSVSTPSPPAGSARR